VPKLVATKLKLASLSDPSVEKFKIEHNYEFQINSRTVTSDFIQGLRGEGSPFLSFKPNQVFIPISKNSHQNVFCLHKRLIMKIKFSLAIAVLVFIFSSCSEISNQIDDKQKQLESKIKSLDSTVNYEVERVKVIDSLVKQEKAAIDSLVKLRTE
jgi:hypothetical protein